MHRRFLIGPERDPLPFPPSGLLTDASLFLDLDGTLLEFMDRPECVRADASLRELLARLAARLDGRIAIVSGRSLEQIDDILGDTATELAVSGSHGCEHRWNGDLIRPDRPAALDRAAERMRIFGDSQPGLLVEEKSFGVALHYRMKPEAQEAVRAFAEGLAAELDLGLQHGNMMVELRVASGNKGSTVRRFMALPPMQGTRPVFIGDDITDEDGFAAAADLGGSGMLIGPDRPTAAVHRLPSPADLRAWLAEAAL